MPNRFAQFSIFCLKAVTIVKRKFFAVMIHNRKGMLLKVIIIIKAASAAAHVIKAKVFKVII